eukprot:Hpha_TRINITY_DN15865_c4_g15::TRINITY_DN15865_c4_g15_i1::g.188430::m.188430/K02295/CRY; cryptochrome
MASVMHWFRRGLRLHDNPGLLAALTAAARGGCVYPVYVLDGDCYQLRHCSPLRAAFLVECLQDLDRNLRARGSRLYVTSGDPVAVLPKLWAELGVSVLTFDADETGEPYAAARDAEVMAAAQRVGVAAQAVVGSETMYPLGRYTAKAASLPGTMSSFQALFASLAPVPSPKPPPDAFPSPESHAKYEGKFAPPRLPTDLPWPRDTPRKEVFPIWGPEDCKGLTPRCRGGETEALKRLEESMRDAKWVASFEKPKTSPSVLEPSTTVLSPHLSMGTLSPRTAWHAVADAVRRAPPSVPRSGPPVSLHGQLLWREFNNLMAHSANAMQKGSWGRMEGNRYCRQIPWERDAAKLEAWRTGRTGYPWIDACMRQLRQEGWIHHLGRHAVACFLTRGDLWCHWEEGAKVFESELLDADYALNNFNWLWLSCSGFFYQYFRCYSPISFQKKNDPKGLYIRRYVPELANMPDKFIYEPWLAPSAVQQKAGCRVGSDYPRPIVDHSKVSKANMEKMSQAYAAAKSAPKSASGGPAPSAKRARKE